MTTPTQMPESLKVVAWMYTHKVSGAECVFDWCWHPKDAAREFHEEAPLCRLADAQSALKDRDAEIERLKSVLRQAKPEMRRLLENSLCAADADRPFSDVLAEVKAHPAIKAIEDAISGAPHA